MGVKDKVCDCVCVCVWGGSRFRDDEEVKGFEVNDTLQRETKEVV